MNSPTSRDPLTTNPANAKTILAEAGLKCSLIMLAPGDEEPAGDGSGGGRHLLYVVEGEAEVRVADRRSVLYRDDAILVSTAERAVISARADGGAKILRVDVPAGTEGA